MSDEFNVMLDLTARLRAHQEATDEIKRLQERVNRLERALGGHLKWMEPPFDAAMPGWKEASELIELMNNPEGRK